VIKHMPGHGRATSDSHLELPRVEASLAELAAQDFRPFEALNDMPIGISAHVCYGAIDADAPATQSAKVIAEIIRGAIGFNGLLLSDDLSMGALSGSQGERAGAALAAGCDVGLHCNGKLDEMADVIASVGLLSADAMRRWSDSKKFTNKDNISEFSALTDEINSLIEAFTSS
jgi:beta-N-acetylhexosaminidase